MQSTPSGESTRTDSAATEPSDATGCADQSEGLRERKKRERGQALRQAALDLALENGYTNVTVEDICERCGVSRRTFFNYFSSKEEALLGRADTVFDDEDQPDIAAFEAGGPNGRLLADLQHLLASVVRTRLNKREEMHQYHLLMKQDPSLMQVQMSRMGNNERLFREMIQRRLDGAAPASAMPAVDENSAAEKNLSATSAMDSSSAGTDSAHCHDDEAVPVSTRAEALAALAMMAIKATFMRLRKVEGAPALVIRELFDELRDVFEEESA
ncbi:TetR/AcrR family transcriptional regulator [Brevibacterium antiquum]|uniref:Transcriptional regulator, TetR family n=1 Tax=Brevibacterium antiquum TaxID=234835 RepID=A0A2H1IRR9_9MICO|nr:TetR/AcrR family transcriptional regulator [Brevibacterium antiquum]SMX77883.1 transcriptional regulator, TetR family [Brevibacterium antiquum]